MQSMDNLNRLIAQHGPEGLFRTPEGRNYLAGALAHLRLAAQCGAATVRLPEIRDKLPTHIRQDILRQSGDLMEFIGRTDLTMLLVEESDPARNPKQWECFTSMFGTLYNETCNREESLRKLCKLTLETYTKGSYATPSRNPDKDY